MTKEECAQKIYDWEMENGESFVDYYAGDRVEVRAWSFWLLGKGYKNKANELINKLAARRKKGDRLYLDQEEMFCVYPVYVGKKYMEKNEIKNREILADFLTDSELYHDRTITWFKKWEAQAGEEEEDDEEGDEQ